MQYVYKIIEEYNLGKKRKILIGFDDMIADMINNKKQNPVITELFIKDFIKIYKKCPAEPYYFLVNDTILPSDNSLRFRKSLLK